MIFAYAVLPVQNGGASHTLVPVFIFHFTTRNPRDKCRQIILKINLYSIIRIRGALHDWKENALNEITNEICA